MTKWRYPEGVDGGTDVDAATKFDGSLELPSGSCIDCAEGLWTTSGLAVSSPSALRSARVRDALFVVVSFMSLEDERENGPWRAHADTCQMNSSRNTHGEVGSYVQKEKRLHHKKSNHLCPPVTMDRKQDFRNDALVGG